MRELLYKMDMEDKIFLVLKRDFKNNLKGEKGFIRLEDVDVNDNVSTEEFVAEVEKQKEVVRDYLKEKRAFVESHKGKVLKGVSQRDVDFLKFSHEDILILDKEIDIKNLSNTNCLRDFKLDPDKVYVGKARLNVDFEELDSIHTTTKKVSYRITTTNWKEPAEYWVEEHAVKLAIYNKISKVFNLDFSCSEYGKYFHMIKDNELLIKDFISKFDISK